MDPNKKPRKDSKLDSMPESRVLELRDKLLANVGHKELLSWLAVECGVTSASSALTAFYKRHCAPMVRDRRKLAVAKSEALGDAMEKDPVNWDAQIIEKVKQYTFEFLDSPDLDPEPLSFLVDSITKANKATLDREKFEEAKRKAQAADEAKEQMKKLREGGKKLPEAEREAILDKVDEILGLKPR